MLKDGSTLRYTQILSQRYSTLVYYVWHIFKPQKSKRYIFI